MYEFYTITIYYIMSVVIDYFIIRPLTPTEHINNFIIYFIFFMLIVFIIINGYLKFKVLIFKLIS